MQRNTPSGVKYGTTGGPFQSEPLIDNNLQCKPPFRIYYTDGCVEADNEGLNILDYVQHSKCNRVLFRILIGPAPIEGTLMDLFIQSKIHNLLTRVIYFFSAMLATYIPSGSTKQILIISLFEYFKRKKLVSSHAWYMIY